MKKLIVPLLLLLVASNIYLLIKTTSLEERLAIADTMNAENSSIKINDLVDELKVKFNHIKQTIWGNQVNRIPPENILDRLDDLERKLSIVGSAPSAAPSY